MGNIRIDLNSKINASPVSEYTGSESRLVGKVIDERMFGVNFLSSFENDENQGFQTYEEIIKTLFPNSQGNQGIDSGADDRSASNLRYPGGALTEKFYARAGNELSIDTLVNYNKNQGVSAREFLSLCEDINANMTQVIPTWRYFVKGGVSSSDKIEIAGYVKSLLGDALQKGVTVNAFELGNEYWSGLAVSKNDIVRMTASDYGKIAAQQAQIISDAITDFQNENQGQIQAGVVWERPKILLQMGAPGGDVENIGRLKAQIDSRSIIDAFETEGQRAAIDGFIVHRYETTIEHVRDPYVLVKPFHLNALPAMLTEPGWKPFDSMTLAVTEWNLDQSSLETGLRSYAGVVAMMGEFASIGVDSADFWSAAARSRFPLARFEGSSFDSDADLSGLTFTGEAFRMMKDSIIGKQSIQLYEKADGALHVLDGNILDKGQNDDLRTHVEAFADKNELVIYLSNTTDQSDKIDLDLSDMLGKSGHYAWASLVESTAVDPLDNKAAPKISNFNLEMSDGFISGIDLDAFESVRISISLSGSGARIFGHDLADDLKGSRESDIIDGGRESDRLSGLAGNDTLLGGQGFDFLRGEIGNDLLYGGNGDDRLNGGMDDDALFGGNGSDTAFFTGSQRVAVDLQVQVSQKTGHGHDLLVGIENIVSGRSHDVLRGDDAANQFTGNAGRDFLDGRGGDDSLYGGIGHDTLVGGAGNDALFGGSGRNQYVFGLGSGNDTIFDFQDGLDQIRLTGHGGDFDSLVLQDSERGVSIWHGLGDSLFLPGLFAGLIGAADFIFG